MHRSGTSAVTRLLSIAGAKLPKTLLVPSSSNPTGHWEPHPLVRYHDALFSKLGSRWDDWRVLTGLTAARQKKIRRDLQAILRAEYGNASLFVVKDPRICRIAPVFLEALANANFKVRAVLPFRNPREVMSSLRRRNRLSHTDSAVLWMRCVLDAEAATRENIRSFVSFDTLLMDWKACFRRLSTQLDLSWTATAEMKREVESFLAASRRPTHEIDQDYAFPVIKDWISEIHSALSALQLDPGNRASLATLDQVRDTLNLATPILTHAAELDRQLVGMRASTSWRITAPLRWIKQKFLFWSVRR